MFANDLCVVCCLFVVVRLLTAFAFVVCFVGLFGLYLVVVRLLVWFVLIGTCFSKLFVCVFGSTCFILFALFACVFPV